MDMAGWDTVFAISLDRVNAALNANADKLPRSLQATSTPSDQFKYSIDAQMAPWQLEQRESGALFNLLIPFRSGSFSALGFGPASLAGVLVSVEVDLRWVPSSVPGSSSVAFSFAAPKSTKTGEVRAGAEELGTTLAPLLPFVVAQFLAAHAGAITYVLASVGPAAGGASWLSPHSSAFSVLRSGGRSFLTILSAADGRDVSRLARDVQVPFPQDADAMFALSQDLVLQRVVAPAMSGAFGIPQGALRFVGADHSLQGGGFGIGGVKSGAITYYPNVAGLRTAIDNDHLITAVHGDCDMKMNITLHFGVQTRSPLSFDAARQTIGFARDPSPEKQKDVSIPWYDWFLGPVADAILAIVVNVIADDLGDKIDNGIASSNALAGIPSAIVWTAVQAPRLTSARLETALVLSATIPH